MLLSHGRRHSSGRGESVRAAFATQACESARTRSRACSNHSANATHSLFVDSESVIDISHAHLIALCEGTGLGLAISKLAQAANGEICCESELGNGSTFCFTIQLQPGSTFTAVKSTSSVDIADNESTESVAASRCLAAACRRDLLTWRYTSRSLSTRAPPPQAHRDLCATCPPATICSTNCSPRTTCFAPLSPR